MMYFRRKVQHGQKKGRELGLPTLNLNVGSFVEHHEPGVYACQVKVKEKWYTGALHFGPKKGSLKPTLEIHLLQFDQLIYGQWITFTVHRWIRATKTFEHWEELKEQIKRDIETIKNS